MELIATRDVWTNYTIDCLTLTVVSDGTFWFMDPSCWADEYWMFEQYYKKLNAYDFGTKMVMSYSYCNYFAVGFDRGYRGTNTNS